MDRLSSRGRTLSRLGRVRTGRDDDTENASLPADHKIKQIFKGKQLWYLAYQSKTLQTNLPLLPNLLFPNPTSRISLISRGCAIF